MKAIGNYILVKDGAQEVRKTSGGLELTDKHEEIRYINADVVSVGDAVIGIACCDSILYDRVGGHNVVIKGEVYKVIRDRDVVLVHEQDIQEKEG